MREKQLAHDYEIESLSSILLTPPKLWSRDALGKCFIHGKFLAHILANPPKHTLDFFLQTKTNLREFKMLYSHIFNLF